MRLNFTNNLYLLFLLIFAVSCQSNGTKIDNQRYPEGLEFPLAKTKQDYSDMVIKAMKTSRYQIVQSEIKKGSAIDDSLLRTYLLSYGQAVNKKKWVYESYLIDEKSKDSNVGYRWIDDRNRTAIIVEIFSSKKNGRYELSKLSFASRLEVLDSRHFPGDTIAEDNILLNSPAKRK